MDPVQAVENIKNHLEQFIESAKAHLEQDLPEVASVAQAAATNPVIAALSAAVHLNEAPDVLASLASAITVLEAKLAAEHAAGVAEGQAAAQTPETPDVPEAPAPA
jgi:hypothetical protein